jgi:hypothetical protein
MFDSFTMAGEKDALLCAAGHECTNFQTKCLECDMSTYYVYDGSLFVVERNGWNDRWEEGCRPHYKGLEITTSRYALPKGHSGHVVLYTSCEQCLPVLSEWAGESAWSDRVHEDKPWVEYEVEFETGRVVGATPIRLETREDIRAKQGTSAIPDEDRVAKRHFERLLKDREKRQSRLGE